MNSVMRQPPVFRYSSLEQAFADIGECLVSDLSVVRMTLIRDVHFDDYELEIAIFGQDDAMDDAPVIDQTLTVPEEAMDGNRFKTGQGGVITLFDRQLHTLMVQRHIRIEWNPGEDSFQEIDPENIEEKSPLLAVDR